MHDIFGSAWDIGQNPHTGIKMQTKKRQFYRKLKLVLDNLNQE